MNYPQYFQDLIEAFNRIPGVGLKSATRMAFSLLETKPEYRHQFISAISAIDQVNVYCHRCHNLTDQPLCMICEDKSRNHRQICVVADIKDLFSIERTGEYHGSYHVLHGLVNVKKGVYPDDLFISDLLERIKACDEVIIATPTTIEGETTALYLSKLLENEQVKVSRLAYGLPIGMSIEYADELTIIRAFEGRHEVKK